MQLDDALARRLHGRARADRWGMSVDRFASILEASLARAFIDAPPSRDRAQRHLESLHLEDLALACACAEGHEDAWEHFVRTLRPVLYRAADAIDPTGAARELADSLYGELFGLTERQGERRSLFRYFHGRSSLATWLRAVLAQRHVDRVRETRRVEQLPVDDVIPGPESSTDLGRPRFVRVMHRAVAAAIARLAPRDRLRLALYYVQALTLAQIGRALHEHEATASRHLARTRRDIRKDVEHQLRHSEGMSDAEVVECFTSVTEDAGTLNLAEMLGAPSSGKKLASDRST